jgi:hypothetical protein
LVVSLLVKRKKFVAIYSAFPLYLISDQPPSLVAYIGDTAAKLGGGVESNYFDEKSKFFYRLLAMQSYIKSIKKNETVSQSSFIKLDFIHSPQNRTDIEIVSKARIFFKNKFNEFFSLAEMGIGDWLDINEIEWNSYKYELFVKNFFIWLSEFNLKF